MTRPSKAAFGDGGARRRRVLTLAPVLILMAVFGWINRRNAPRDYTESVEGVDFVMKAIDGGLFMMGCGLHDEPCRPEEWVDRAHRRAQIRVSLPPFYLAETETPWALYQQCIAAGACPDNRADGDDHGWGKGLRPVIEVSRDDVTGAFLPWLNAKTGKRYRLPTEAEWEYAARAGSIRRYSWGASIDCDRAQYGYGAGECGRQAGTVPVRSFRPNANGLYDVHGNVRELVLRGGSWMDAGTDLRSATRFLQDRRAREASGGFRLAHDVEP
jgi:formylglycine-generating enzyme required for sulfatase activity